MVNAERESGLPCHLRQDVKPEDVQTVRRIVAATGFFTPREVEVAVELVVERLSRGECSGYSFLFAELAGRSIGYACYGPIPCTAASFDLFWIAVEPQYQHAGLGRRLLAEVESQVRLAAGRRLYIETSNRAQYATTRSFYEKCGYQLEAVLRDFYAPGDDKVIFVKRLGEVTCPPGTSAATGSAGT